MRHITSLISSHLVWLHWQTASVFHCITEVTQRRYHFFWPTLYTGPIFTKFSRLVVVCVEVINLPFVLQSLNWRCYGNQLIFWAIWNLLTYLLTYVVIYHIYFLHWHLTMDWSGRKSFYEYYTWRWFIVTVYKSGEVLSIYCDVRLCNFYSEFAKTPMWRQLNKASSFL